MASQLCGGCGAAVAVGTRYCTTCGMSVSGTAHPAVAVAAQPGSADLAPGLLLDRRYEVVAALARGGMSAVYEARDMRLGNRRCAVKVLRDLGTTAQEQQEAARWFAREAHILSGLRHPAIPHVHDYFSEAGRHYLVMELVDGRTLDAVLTEQGTPGLPPTEVLAWADQLCDVLRYLHERQPPLIFRDLKPENIMLERAGTLKLIDFGIARTLAPVHGGRTVYTTIGTPGYSPPEQYQGLADARSDVYALAATLHHLLSGRDPRQYPPCTYPPLGTLVAGLPPGVEAALATALRFRAEERFDSIAAFSQALLAQGAVAPAASGRLKPRGAAATRPFGSANYAGQTVASVVFRGQRYPTATWKDVLMTVVAAIQHERPAEFERCLSVKGRQKPYFSRTPDDLTQPARVGATGIYVETKFDANAVVKVCHRLLDAFGYPRSDLQITLR